MRDAQDVIASAVNGHTEELAAEYEVSTARMYQLLSTHCPYGKAKILIRCIAKVNPSGARLIKSDLDSMFSDIFAGHSEEVTEVDLHREAFEAVQACLEHKSRADRKRELRELISVAQMMLESTDKDDRRERAKKVVEARFK